MPRKHLFTLLVLTGAAAVAGLVALTSTADLGQAAKASSTPDPAIGYRLQQLDGLESDLRRQLADSSARTTAPTETIYRRPAAPPAATRDSDSDSDSEDDQYERESADDQREDDHEDQGGSYEHEEERDD
jgi:hypothetical protein